MHVGGVRTALFAWLVARQAEGQFILRLEDTDQEREVAGSAEHIMAALTWLGLNWDEGPDIGGPHGPYRQSQRLDTYKEWAQKLIDAGRAYADPYSEAELANLRQQAKADKKAFLFREHRPENPSTWNGNQPLRFKSEPESYQWHDEVMGDLSTGPEAVDDFILIKSDGFPTYNFAHVVDDHLMQVSHVIRSQEFLPSVPKYLNLYEALSLDRPALATLPYVLGPDGGKKLSKRDGAKDILEYRSEGLLPNAIINYLASLGWNDGTEQEIFSRQELVSKFDLGRVQKSGARFDEEKLTWLNWQHVKRLVEAGQTEQLSTQLPLTDDLKHWLAAGDRQAQLNLAVTKASSLESLADQLSIFSAKPDPQLAPAIVDEVKGTLTPEAAVIYLRKAVEAANAAPTFTASELETALRQAMEELSAQPRVFLNLIRWVVSGRQVSPSLFEMLAALGPEEVEARLNNAIEALSG